jgi:transposase
MSQKINGVKRHILVDTLGLLLAVVVHPANIQDRDGAKLVFAKAKLLGSWPRMERVWADGGYAGKLIAWVASFVQWTLEIVKRNDDVKGFKLLPKRDTPRRTPPRCYAARGRFLFGPSVSPGAVGFESSVLFASVVAWSFQMPSSVNTTNRTSVFRRRHL